MRLRLQIIFFKWHVIQGWSVGLTVTILLGKGLSAACIIALVMSSIFWSMFLVNCVFFFMNAASRKIKSEFFKVF